LEGAQGDGAIVGKEQEFFAVSGEADKSALLAWLPWCGKKLEPRGSGLYPQFSEVSAQFSERVVRTRWVRGFWEKGGR
jgi:hypothetical protein